MQEFRNCQINGAIAAEDMPAGWQWNAQKYENAVLHHLKNISATVVGDAVLASLEDRGAVVAIVGEDHAVGRLEARYQNAGGPDRQCAPRPRGGTIRFTPGKYIKGSWAYRDKATLVQEATGNTLEVDMERFIRRGGQAG